MVARSMRVVVLALVVLALTVRAEHANDGEQVEVSADGTVPAVRAKAPVTLEEAGAGATDVDTAPAKDDEDALVAWAMDMDESEKAEAELDSPSSSVAKRGSGEVVEFEDVSDEDESDAMLQTTAGVKTKVGWWRRRRWWYRRRRWWYRRRRWWYRRRRWWYRRRRYWYRRRRVFYASNQGEMKKGIAKRKYMSFKVYNTDHYLHAHTLNHKAIAKKAWTTADKKAATFRIVNGLYHKFGVSFQSMDHPSYYLVYHGGHMQLRTTGSTVAKQEASFLVRHGFKGANLGYVSFEAYRHRGHFLTAVGTHQLKLYKKANWMMGPASFMPELPRYNKGKAFTKPEHHVGWYMCSFYSCNKDDGRWKKGSRRRRWSLSRRRRHHRRRRHARRRRK